MINHNGKKWNSEDIRMEEVHSIGGRMSDAAVAKIKDMGLMTPELDSAMENEVYTAITDFLEELFDYPEYRYHN